MNKSTDNQLEGELQELYILAEHWSADLDFLEEELRFFKNVLRKFADLKQDDNFEKKVIELEGHLASLRVKIPGFLNFLKPFIANPNQTMDLGFLEKYNSLANELRQLFSGVRAAKKELFAHAEALMAHVR